MSKRFNIKEWQEKNLNEGELKYFTANVEWVDTDLYQAMVNIKQLEKEITNLSDTKEQKIAGKLLNKEIKKALSSIFDLRDKLADLKKKYS
ncbi:MAG TPA: hypothetical protein DF712_01965 [Balneola sp.]|nr:hypothetical protein [Balneola sp.]